MEMALTDANLQAQQLTDEQVVQRVLTGETSLFEVIMRRYNQRLYRAARAITRSDSEAEDVLQDAYVRAFQHLVFEQDRLILESQRPKKLPLASRAEMPQRADALSIAYRRYLHDSGLRFGITATMPTS